MKTGTRQLARQFNATSRAFSKRFGGPVISVSAWAKRLQTPLWMSMNNRTRE